MSTKKLSGYQRLTKKFGEPTFSNYLLAIIKTDFESKAACARKLEMGPQALQDYLLGILTSSDAFG